LKLILKNIKAVLKKNLNFFKSTKDIPLMLPLSDRLLENLHTGLSKKNTTKNYEKIIVSITGVFKHILPQLGGSPKIAIVAR
jgi:hypothetical protein